MKDLFHTITNLVSYNRYTFLAAMLAACTIGLSACSFTATAPDGTKKDKDALITDAEAKAAAAKNAIAKADRDREKAVMDANRKKEAQLRAIAMEFEGSVADATLAYQDLLEKQTAELEEFTSKTADAIAKIEAKEEVVKNVFGVVDGLMQSASATLGPVGSTIWGSVATMVAGGLLFDNRRKDKKIAAAKAPPPSV